ncbi:MAG: GIDE domain-containing protein [Terriglobales bacterium]
MLALARSPMNIQEGLILGWVGLVVGAVVWLRGFRILRRRRLIENTPTSKCSTVAPGLVEVEGKAMGGKPIFSLIVGLPCYCSRLIIERRDGNNWLEGHSDAVATTFYVEDETGRVRVEPTGAELDLHEDAQFEVHYGQVSAWKFLAEDRRNKAGNVAARFKEYCAAHGVTTTEKDHVRVTERNLLPESKVYVLGTANAVSGAAEAGDRVQVRRQRGNPFFVAESSQKEVLQALHTSVKPSLYGGGFVMLASAAWLLIQ